MALVTWLVNHISLWWYAKTNHDKIITDCAIWLHIAIIENTACCLWNHSARLIPIYPITIICQQESSGKHHLLHALEPVRNLRSTILNQEQHRLWIKQWQQGSIKAQAEPQISTLSAPFPRWPHSWTNEFAAPLQEGKITVGKNMSKVQQVPVSAVQYIAWGWVNWLKNETLWGYRRTSNISKPRSALANVGINKSTSVSLPGHHF